MESITERRGPICPMCNIVAIKLVPLYDNDQDHKNTQCCIKCKRALRAGKEITKIDRSKLIGGK